MLLNSQTNPYVGALAKFTQKHVGTTLYLARHSLTALYLFLEFHELGYLPEIVWIWFTEVQNGMGSSWKLILEIRIRICTNLLLKETSRHGSA